MTYSNLRGVSRRDCKTLAIETFEKTYTSPDLDLKYPPMIPLPYTPSLPGKRTRNDGNTREVVNLALEILSRRMTVKRREEIPWGWQAPEGYVSALYELCQRCGWNVPRFTFQLLPIERRWVCDVSCILREGWFFSSKGDKSFSRKKHAQEDAAKAAYEWLTELITLDKSMSNLYAV